jgi:hypothetical protein
MTAINNTNYFKSGCQLLDAGFPLDKEIPPIGFDLLSNPIKDLTPEVNEILGKDLRKTMSTSELNQKIDNLGKMNKWIPLLKKAAIVCFVATIAISLLTICLAAPGSVLVLAGVVAICVGLASSLTTGIVAEVLEQKIVENPAKLKELINTRKFIDNIEFANWYKDIDVNMLANVMAREDIANSPYKNFAQNSSFNYREKTATLYKNAFAKNEIAGKVRDQKSFTKINSIRLVNKNKQQDYKRISTLSFANFAYDEFKSTR